VLVVHRAVRDGTFFLGMAVLLAGAHLLCHFVAIYLRRRSGRLRVMRGDESDLGSARIRD
jgi:hypothetical protein